MKLDPFLLRFVFSTKVGKIYRWLIGIYNCRLPDRMPFTLSRVRMCLDEEDRDEGSISRKYSLNWQGPGVERRANRLWLFNMEQV